ncbi:MAG: hypothetical protein J0H28_06325 [Methylibium petroleiphilum]|nr:hypothetical protein [Methylibium petroleiphilum]
MSDRAPDMQAGHAPQRGPLAFSIDVRHAYFDDVGASVPVAWQLVEPPPARFSTLGLVVHVGPKGLSVFRSEGSGGDAAAADLVFRLTATDPAFSSYTDIDIADPDSTLWFDSATAPAADGDSDTARRLHVGATASAADRAAREALPLLRSITQHAAPALVGFVRIRWSSADPPGQAWLIAFDARAVVWKYSVRGSSGRALFIRDADGQVDFEPATATPLPGDTGTVVLRSTAAIPFREHSPRRFQLMEATPHGERSLIHRLPVASPSALARETVNGRDLMEAEIDVDL